MANIRLDVNHMMKDFLGERGIDGAEMNALYQSMLVGGPVAYVQALLEGMMRAGRLRPGDAHALAIAYYAPMLLMILMSDDQAAAPESAALLERHIDRFMEEHAIR